MKLVHFFILAYLTLPIGCFGQWSPVYTHADQYSALYATDSNTVHVVTSWGGRIHSSYDGGDSWTMFQTFVEHSWLVDMSFPSTQVGYACGGTAFGSHRNILIGTTDGGVSWDSITSNDYEGYTFSNLHFINDSVGFVAQENNGLLKTTDGGKSFVYLNIPDTQAIYTINDIQFSDDQIGYILTREPYDAFQNNVNRILKSIDQGLTWNEIYRDTTFNALQTAGIRTLNDIDIVNQDTLFVVGNNGRFMKSVDAGNQWTISSLAPGSSDLTSVDFINSSIGYVNNAGGMYVTTDGGNNWQVQSMLPPAIVSRIHMVEDRGFLIAGQSIYKTSNGGLLGMEVDVNSNIQFFPNPTTGQLNINLPSDNTNLLLDEIAAYDLLGKRIAVFDVNQKVFNLEKFPTGQYFMVLRTVSGQHFTFPIQKK